MRAIKFRGYDKTQKILFDWSWFSDNLVCEMFDNEDYIIMQFTGLHDKMGREIFEGDIVKCHNVMEYDMDAIGLLQVAWDLAHCRFTLENEEYKLEYFDIDVSDIEVIGNIYENPDLLEVQ